MATPQTPSKEDIILPRDNPRERVGTTPRVAVLRAPTRNLSPRVSAAARNVPASKRVPTPYTVQTSSTNPESRGGHIAGPPQPYHPHSVQQYGGAASSQYREQIPRNRMRPAETIIVETAFAVHSIPNYEAWDDDQVSREYGSLHLKLAQLRRDWSHIPGLVIDGPRDNETIVNLAVRYREYEQFVLSHNGSDFWFIALVAAWTFAEWAIAELGFPADGFVLSQIKMSPMYQACTKKMGKGGAFGEGWSPMTQICVISGINITMLAVVSRLFPAMKEYAPMVMGELAKSICGNESTVKYSEAGTPLPSQEKTLAEKVTAMVPEGAMEKVRAAGGIGGMIKLGMTFLNMGGGAGKKASNSDNKHRQKRQEGPEESF